MRQLFLDTETTGLDVNDGHKMIEIAILEMVDRKITTNYIQFYLNPQRLIDEGATRIHGITNEQLLDKPKFEEVIDEIIEFVDQSEIIIHNAKFDLSFLNKEFLALKNRTFDSYVNKVIDTLIMARGKYPGAKNSLNVLCDRFKIDKTKRKFHGALIDCELLAEVYLKLTEENTSLLSFHDEKQNNSTNLDGKFNKFDTLNLNLMVIKPSLAEINVHNQILKDLHSSSKGNCEWYNKNSIN